MGTRDLTSCSVGWSGVADAYAETFAPLCAGAFAEVMAGVGVHDVSTRRVLDVGTGTGALAALATQAGATVTAVDPDPEMLRIAARTAPNVLLRQADSPTCRSPTATSTQYSRISWSTTCRTREPA